MLLWGSIAAKRGKNESREHPGGNGEDNGNGADGEGEDGGMMGESGRKRDRGEQEEEDCCQQ